MRWQTKFGACIYTSASGYKVHENYFYRWLTLDSKALQTVINKKKPGKPILYYVQTFTLMTRALPGNSCLLGLGGAAVAQLLSTFPGSITAVDNSDEVIEIAQNYFMIDKIPELTVIHQSAEQYLEQNQTKYTHLLVDLYNAHCFPDECNNEHFFLQCKNRLQEEGFMAINLANSKEQYAILQLIKKQFNNTLVIPIKKCANIIIIASNHAQKTEFTNIILNTKEIKQIIWDSLWGFVGYL
jgi:precorrin-6B methylase 2